jgi:tetratricopeptide (TPR) repeat protein
MPAAGARTAAFGATLRMEPRRLARALGCASLLAAVLIAGCAKRPVVAPAPVAPKFPDFLFPAIPQGLDRSLAGPVHERAWDALQAGELRAAEQTFNAALTMTPAFYPAAAGLGYVSLAEQEYEAAIDRFERVLSIAPEYVPALVGLGDALLAVDRPGDAVERFEAAAALDPSLTTIRRRADVLRFRAVQDYVARARRAAEAGRGDEALQFYGRALAASPESPFLYREMALVEQRQGRLDEALQHAAKAAALEPSDARAQLIAAEIHEARGEFDAAVRAYDAAYAIEPSEAVATRLERARERAELARLPEEYRAIASAESISRGELAALIGVRLGSFVEGTAARESVVITDTRRHWAAAWIHDVARAGIMEVYANHTFEPDAPVRRGDLGRVVSRLLDVVAARRPALARTWEAAPIKFSDLGPGHLSYLAASRAVAAGVLQVREGDAFQLSRPVSGAEAVAAMDRLDALASNGGRTPE